MTPREMIRELEDLEARQDLIRSDLEAKRAEILRPVAAAKDRVVEAVKHAGESVKGERLMAVWSKPRTTWDGKALEGYAAAHPEINQFRKVGEPTVSIRNI